MQTANRSEEVKTRGRGALGIDFTPGPGHAPGVGRYVRELVRALVRIEGTPPLRRVEYGRAPRPMDGAPLGLSNPEVIVPHRRVPIRIPRRALRILSPWIAEKRQRGCALFHRIEPGRPASIGIPSTLAIAELPPASSPAHKALARAVRTASRVLTFSLHARDRITSELDVDPTLVHAVPVGVEHWVRDLNQTGPLPARQSRDVLVLGAIREARKPLFALRGFEALLEREAARTGTGERARLVIAGRPGDAAHAFRQHVAQSPARDAIRWIDAPSEERMPDLVGGAATLLHLADDEISPVTPLEATRMGLSVVASPLPAFREVLEENARWVDFTDPVAIGAALFESIDEGIDPRLRSSRAQLAASYTWDASARAHLAVWRSML